MASNLGCDELVESITLYRPKHWLFHGYVFPFILLYMTHFYWWIYIYGYEEYFEIAMILLSVIGIVQILTGLCCFWSVHVRCFLTCSKVRDPFKAKLVKVVPTPNNGSSELLLLNRIQESESSEVALWFEFQKIKYIYDASEKKRFETIDFPISEFLECYYDWKGYQEDSEIIAAEHKFGKNQLVMVIPEFMELFLERATAPFFVFQVFCVGLWCLDEYWYYSLFTLMMLVAFECILVHQQIRNMAEIRKMGNKPFPIQVYRNRRWRGMMTDELVPGDIVSVGRSQNDKLVPCDLLLLKGPCIVDESMLTGESVPQMKEPIENIERVRNLNIETDGKLHVLFGGTKIVQHSSPPKIGNGLKGPDGGCVAYVLRTGFHTSQGKLLRTILFGVKRVTANNKEAFAFILFLLVFAVAAASYVWIKGTQDPDRNQYKLFLECALIITTVVPPELPVELSLAVNTSLGSLAKLGVYCTEPFRIPFAGKIGLCCFDKTGTLTSDDLVVEGVAGLSNDMEVTEISQIPLETIQVLSTCHSLVQLNDGIVGDPLEKTTLTAIQWNLTKGDAVVPQRGKHPGLKIFHRFHFTSALKRMSVIAGFSDPNSNETIYFGAMKGAPETLRSMYSSVPQYYDEVYLKMTRRGARVLALGRKHLGKLGHQEVRDITRESLESDMTFVGFVVISCPLKPDSKSVIKEILNSTHEVIIITGDNPLTACHVANELKFTRKPKTLILTESVSCWEWISVDESIKMNLIPDLPYYEFVKIFDLCITGEGLSYLNEHHPQFLFSIVPFVRVFARVAPKQKELVITTLKRRGHSVLMCGDGTNDVGALKHADVGVAILSSNHFEATMRSTDSILGEDARIRQTQSLTTLSKPSKKLQNPSRRTTSQGKLKTGREVNDSQGQIKSLLRELEEQEANQVVKLGDASIAAPFTSKLSSIVSVCHIIKQGRCTLVTTLQMFKILALNALIMAYCQSVLYLEGIKFSDTQATLQGLLLAGCFLFISKSKPLKHLSKERPLPNIFNMYTIATVLLQFVVHFSSLLFLVHKAMELSPKEENNVGKKSDEEEKFEPNLINSTVYIISVALQIATFAINYRGHPFMESMFENKHLMYSLLWSAVGVLILALGIVPDFSNQFEIIIFPPDFRNVLLLVLLGDFFLALLVDRVLLYLLGEGKLVIE